MALLTKYPYLKDSSFLMDFAKEKNLEQIVKISILNFNDKTLKEIQSLVLSGNIIIDGNSAIRRTANLSIFIEENEASYMEIGGLFSLNKKVKIEMGFVNRTGKYTNHPVLWFPLGIYVIMGMSSSHGIDGTNVSLQLKDKMVFLNGECGGVIGASTVFHEYEEIDPSTGNYYIKQPTIVQIIEELVNHFGGEQLGKIIISDIDTRIKKVMKWNQNVPLYLYSENQQSAIFSLNEQLEGYDASKRKTFNIGEDVGYIYVDFYYPGELIANAGDNVCSILDKIKNTLGNFEYFYDLEGNFIFQEIKNYLNTSQVKSLGVDTINQDDYLINTKRGTSVYEFNNPEIISSYSNNPQYNQIKNDFIVWGQRTGVDDTKYPIRYHLAIDSKPETGNTYSCYFHTEEDGIVKAKLTTNYANKASFPEVGEIGRLYKSNAGEVGKNVYAWDPEKEDYVQTNLKTIDVTTKDWRSELYFQGALTTRFGQDSNPYYTELVNEWPKLYKVEESDSNKQGFREDVINYPDGLDYYLDFIDSTAAISELSISNIGRRTKIINDDSINCIFEKPIPDFVLIETGQDNTLKLKQECEDRVQAYIQVSSSIYGGLAPGGRQNSAYNAVRDLLYQYTSYNESVSVQMIPLYFLEPNIRVTLQDSSSGIKGDYMINSISLSLDVNGSMSLSCIKALERI